MVRTFLMTAAVFSMLLLPAADEVLARGGRGGRGGCGGGGGGCGGGGCGGGGCYSHCYYPCYSHCYSSHCGGGFCGGGGCGGGFSGGGFCYGGGFGGAAYAAATTDSQATIVVSLPADATLTVDGQATTSTSATRVLYSPALETGHDYVYTLQAQVTREGKTESLAQRVTVRAGQETRVQFELPAAGVAAR